VFSFTDREGKETLVGFKGDNLVIEQKWGNEWVRFIPAATFLFEEQDKLISRLGSRYLVHHFTGDLFGGPQKSRGWPCLFFGDEQQR